METKKYDVASMTTTEIAEALVKEKTAQITFNMPILNEVEELKKQKYSLRVQIKKLDLQCLDLGRKIEELLCDIKQNNYSYMQIIEPLQLELKRRASVRAIQEGGTL